MKYTLMFSRLFLLIITFNTFGICAFSQISNLPPVLIYPGDKDIIIEKLPSFAWSSTGTQFEYKFKLVEVLDGQSSIAAIQSNPVLLEVESKTNLLPYPINAQVLENGKTYAWQVTSQYFISSGELGKMLPALSEVFIFTINPYAKEKCLAILTDKKDEKFYVIENYELKFEFENLILNDENSILKYSILNADDSKIVSEGVSPTKMRDPKYFLLSLKKFPTFRKNTSKNKFYLLRAIDDSGQSYQVKFICN